MPPKYNFELKHEKHDFRKVVYITGGTSSKQQNE